MLHPLSQFCIITWALSCGVTWKWAERTSSSAISPIDPGLSKQLPRASPLPCLYIIFLAEACETMANATRCFRVVLASDVLLPARVGAARRLAAQWLSLIRVPSGGASYHHLARDVGCGHHK